METLYAVVIFAVLLPELHAVAPAFPSKRQAWAPRPQASGGQVITQGREAGADDEREQINTVAVSCRPDSLEIVIRADLFGVGAPVRSSDVRLGVEDDERCRATGSSSEEYRITVGLLDCGTKHWMTQDSLVYTNLLIYSPEPPTGGVVRMEEAVIPIECHYNRKYSLSSPALSPTWLPFVSTLSAVKKLNFDLKIMTPDWVYKRGSNVFFLGEDIHIEASVRRGHHIGLRVFLSTCVATLTPDEHSMPRFVFVEDGCLLDSQLPHSRSQFLPRVADDKLHLVLDAFRFHNEDRAELYITCHVTAVPVHDAEAPNKACTFVNGRWRSADDNDYLCGHCQTQNEEGHIKDKPSSQFRPRAFGGPEIHEHSWRSGQKTEQEMKKAKVGPIVVLPTEQTTEPELQIPTYGSGWRSGLHQKTGLTDSEVAESEGLIANVTGFVPDEFLSSEENPEENPDENPENITETEQDFHPDETINDYADEHETLEEATNDLAEATNDLAEATNDLAEATNDFESSEKLVPKVVDVQEYETTPNPSDTLLTPVYNITTAMNDTDSALSDAYDPKR